MTAQELGGSMRLKVFVVALLLSVGLAAPMPNPERKELLKPLGKSQFIEVNCGGVNPANFYIICGETRANFALFSSLINTYFSTDLPTNLFKWGDAWKKDSKNNYTRTFTYKKRKYTTVFTAVQTVLILSSIKQ